MKSKLAEIENNYDFKVKKFDIIDNDKLKHIFTYSAKLYPKIRKDINTNTEIFIKHEIEKKSKQDKKKYILGYEWLLHDYATDGGMIIYKFMEEGKRLIDFINSAYTNFEKQKLPKPIIYYSAGFLHGTIRIQQNGCWDYSRQNLRFRDNDVFFMSEKINFGDKKRYMKCPECGKKFVNLGTHMRKHKPNWRKK